MESRHPTKQRLGISWIWWVIISALLVWTIWTVWPKSSSPPEISYSTFISQVKAGNVSNVQIQGCEIRGAVVKPITAQKARSVLSLLPSAAHARYSSFRTLFPAVIGDPGLIPLLTAHGVEVNVSPPSTVWSAALSTSGLPILLLVLALTWTGRNAWRNWAAPILSRRIAGQSQKKIELPKATFADIAGDADVKEQLKDVVEYLRFSQKNVRNAGRIPAGILLVGPPGTGKTLVARALAGEAGASFFCINAREYAQNSANNGGSRLHEIFTRARTSVPSIVFIDPLEAIGRRHGTGQTKDPAENDQILNQLLQEIDELEEPYRTIVLAATSHPELLEPGLLQPGYFDRQVVLALPDRLEREAILSLNTRNIHLAPEVDLHLVARTTTGFSGADLVDLCNEARMKADLQGQSQVGMSDFEDALDKLLLSSKHNLLLNDSSRRVVAYHEAGHALVAWLTPAADTVHRVTIIQHEEVLGFTDQISSGDGYNISQEYLLARLSIMLGGRAAEEIAIGSLTTGAEKDLVEATRLARRMVTRWGMGSLGPVALDTGTEQPAKGAELAQGREYSEELAARIDKDVLQLLGDRYLSVRSLLEGSRQKLDRLVEVLIMDESIDADGLVKILGHRPLP